MSDGAEALFSTPLAQLPFPARMEGFIARRGLSTVLDLVAIAPSALFLEPNLGRKSVADSKAILQGHLGIPWETARERYVLPPRGSTPAVAVRTPAEQWAMLRSLLADEFQGRRVEEVEALPTRIHTFARRESIERISELLAVEYDELARAAGVGAGSLRAALEVLRGLSTRSEPPPAQISEPLALRVVEDPLPPGSTWRSLLAGALRHLGSNERLVLTQRAGLAGPIPTLAELGECLGVSRERIRQHESKALERVRRSAWREPARERLAKAVHSSKLIVLSAWSHGDELFGLAEEDTEAFSIFVNEVLESPIRVVAIEETHVLTRVGRAELENELHRARSHAQRLAYPMARGEHLVALARSLELPLEEIASLAPLLEGEWIVEGDVVSGFGTTKRGAILAYVRAARRPVSKSEIEERFGRVNLSDDFVFVDHGLVAVPETIPDWERWRRRLPPAVRTLIERHGAERQWTTHELVPLLAEEADLPAWLNDWTLGSILRDAPDVRYLGRNVVALAESTDGRIHVYDLAVALLSGAGGPLLEEELLQLLTQKRGLGAHTWSMLRQRRPFIFFEDGRIGLSPRDIAGGGDATKRFCDAMFDKLDARQTGLRMEEVREVLAAQGEPIVLWDLRAARSLLHHDGRFRCAAGGAVGLAEWEDARAPSQPEILEELMLDHDGILPIEIAMAALPTASGEPLNRGRIGLLANSIRARLVGAYIEWMVDEVSLPSAGSLHASPLVERVLAALPEDTLLVFRELLEKGATGAELHRTLIEWKRVMRAEATTNPSVEAEQVERLAVMGDALLDRLAQTTDPDEVRLYAAAVGYLASIDDGQPDTALGGLDDDELVLDVVGGMLGAPAG